MRLRVTPGARTTAIAGVMPTADGPALKISVNTPPEDGRANKAVIALLSTAWDIPKTALSLLSGQTGRIKVIEISGDGPALQARLTAWLSAL